MIGSYRNIMQKAGKGIPELSRLEFLEIVQVVTSSRLPILAKNNFFVSMSFLGAKTGENYGWQHLDPTHSPKGDVVIFIVCETFFSKYLHFLLVIERSHWVEQSSFFACNWKISLSGAKNYKKLWSKYFFYPEILVPEKCTNYWPAEEIYISKKLLIRFFWFFAWI